MSEVDSGLRYAVIVHRILVPTAHAPLSCSRSCSRTCQRRGPLSGCWPFVSLPPPFSSLARAGPAPRAPTSLICGPPAGPSSPLSPRASLAGVAGRDLVVLRDPLTLALDELKT